MIITKKRLARRTFLRGLGASVALPLLDSMIPALVGAASVTPARRLGFIYMPMGANLPLWTPKGVGQITELSPALATLTPFLDHLTILSNFELKNAYSGGNHATANAAFLSSARAKMTEGSDYELGITVDQLAAKQLGADTRFPSMELCMDSLTPVGSCDNGYACAYQNNLSWSSPTTPLPAEANPRVVFDRIFGDGSSPAEMRNALRRSGSLLDQVTDDIQRLRRETGPADAVKIDQYLDTVRELERRVQRAERQSEESPLPDFDRPLGVPASYAEHAKLMFDLQALSFQADVTRVITFQLARETSTRTYPEVGVSEAHHAVSHHGDDPEKLAKLAKINALHVSLFAYFLNKLKATPEGDGTLLDHSILLYGSGMGNPNIHDHVRLPIVVAGGAANKLKGARHISYPEPKPLANLHLTLLAKAGVKLDQFVDSNGLVDEVLPL